MSKRLRNKLLGSAPDIKGSIDTKLTEVIKGRDIHRTKASRKRRQRFPDFRRGRQTFK